MEYRTATVSQLSPSPLNPRKYFDQGKLDELAETFKSVGIVEPLVVRPAKPPIQTDFEICAGERRWRAAKIAGLSDVPIIVKDLSDEQMLEVMVIENDQREDVNPLEKAEGYKKLIESGYKIERLAERIGRSKRWIFDSVKLAKDLIDDAKQLLLTNKITLNHGILLSRLTPQQQRRAIDPKELALFTFERASDEPAFEFQESRDKKAAKKQNAFDARYDGYKAASVRELQGWINLHCRFEKSPDLEINRELFPETVQAIRQAEEQREKIIQITHDYYIQPDAKEGNAERIYTVRSWKLADGSSKKAKTCEHAITGVVVVGFDRGKAYKVCVNKDCAVHWQKERSAAAARQKVDSSARAREEARRKAEERERQKEEEQRLAWKRAVPKLVEACAEKLKTASIGALVEILERAMRHDAEVGQARKLLPTKKDNAESILRMYALAVVISEASNFYWAPRDFPSRAKRFGLDVRPIVYPAKTEGGIDPESEAAKQIHALHTSAEGAKRGKSAAKKKAPKSGKSSKPRKAAA